MTPSLIALFIAPLNRAGIEYLVTGGLAQWITQLGLGAEWAWARAWDEPD